SSPTAWHAATVLSSARSSATISMPSAGPFSAHVRDGDLVEPPARLDHLVAKLLVDRDHVLVGGRVPCRDPLQLRLSRREQLKHRDLGEQAEAVTAMSP